MILYARSHANFLLKILQILISIASLLSTGYILGEYLCFYDIQQLIVVCNNTSIITVTER